VPQAFFGLHERALRLIQIGTTDIGQLHALEVIPPCHIPSKYKPFSRKNQALGFPHPPFRDADALVQSPPLLGGDEDKV